MGPKMDSGVEAEKNAERGICSRIFARMFFFLLSSLTKCIFEVSVLSVFLVDVSKFLSPNKTGSVYTQVH